MDVFSAINAAEAEARDIISIARNTAVTNKENAVKDGKAFAEEAAARARIEVERIIEEAVIDSKKKSDGLITTTDNRKAILRERTEKRIEEAANMIVESVVRD